MATILIAPCSCKHEYQDKHHGDGMRVWTIGKKEMTCTVCGTRKPNQQAEKKV